jgi:hypothetical protein
MQINFTPFGSIAVFLQSLERERVRDVLWTSAGLQQEKSMFSSTITWASQQPLLGGRGN